MMSVQHSSLVSYIIEHSFMRVGIDVIEKRDLVVWTVLMYQRGLNVARCNFSDVVNDGVTFSLEVMDTNQFSYNIDS